tara:strand:- start:153 stop:638 length:486 start_codon:yes stop_codon:yes gene_type:complete
MTTAIKGNDTSTFGGAIAANNVSAIVPTFSVYLDADQTVSANIPTKITFNTKDWDTDNSFDATTNYRFQPTVAGYYQISASMNTETGAPTRAFITIYKNGSQFKRGTDSTTTNSRQNIISTLIHFNGTTDYIEFYAYTTATTIRQYYQELTYATGYLARAA